MYSEEVVKVQTDCEKAKRDTGSSDALHALVESKVRHSSEVITAPIENRVRATGSNEVITAPHREQGKGYRQQ